MIQSATAGSIFNCPLLILPRISNQYNSGSSSSGNDDDDDPGGDGHPSGHPHVADGHVGVAAHSLVVDAGGPSSAVLRRQ